MLEIHEVIGLVLEENADITDAWLARTSVSSQEETSCLFAELVRMPIVYGFRSPGDQSQVLWQQFALEKLAMPTIWLDSRRAFVQSLQN